MMPLALVTAVAMLVGWFPLSTLWHQQTQLDAAQAQLNAIRAEQRALRVEAHSIDSNAAATLLAREQYQLVAPGQSLIQVLPGTSTASGTQYSGDPGLQPLAAPSSLASLPAASTTHPHTSPTKGFVSRLLHTLEFWH